MKSKLLKFDHMIFIWTSPSQQAYLMKSSFLALLFFCIASVTHSQRPIDGSYTYKIAFAEWGGKSNGATCTVIIKGDSIKVIQNGTGNLAGKKGDIIDQGILMTHKRTGKWIIAHNTKDIDAKEVGGCTEGPSEIDFKHKRFWLC
jgi:hypothetical protein